MKYVSEFIAEYGFQIIFAILTALAGFFGVRIKKILEEKEISDEKRKIVKTVVKAVEQLYNDLDGAAKLEKAKENIIEMLTIKGIEISEIELNMLIEAVVSEFNYGGGKDD